MWRRSGKVDPEQAYLARRSSQFLTAVKSVTQDIEQWAQSRPALESFAASAFTNRCLIDYGSAETASLVFDELPKERAAEVERAARELFRMTDPELVSAQHSVSAAGDELAALFVEALTDSVESLTSSGFIALSERDLLSTVGRRMAKAAMAPKKPSTEQLEQRGIDNVVTLLLLSRWVDLVDEMRELPDVQRPANTVHEIRFDSVTMRGKPPRSAQDLLGTTRIEDGTVTLDARGVERTPSERLTDAYLAFQVGEFHLAAPLYSVCEQAGILTARRREEMRIVTMVSEGDHEPIANSPLGESSDERLQFLIGDSPRPYLHDFPDDVEPGLEQLLDAALLAEEDGRIDDFMELVDQISLQQVPPPGLTLAVAYRSLLTNRNARCMEECRKLIDVPTYHSEDMRLRALEFLATAAMREGNPKTALYAALEALRINISSASALMSLAGLVNALNGDEEMNLLLQLRAIAVLEAEGDFDQAAQKLANLKAVFGGDRCLFS